MEMYTGAPAPTEESSEAPKPLGRPVGSHTGRGYHWSPTHEKPLHDALVDQMVANPSTNCIQLAKLFGYSPQAMRMMLKSDLIKEKLAARRADLVDPILKTTIEDQFAAMLEVSLTRATELISVTTDADVALKGVDVGARALGYGARVAPQTTQNQFVVVNPGVAPNSAAWAQAYGPLAHGGEVVDLDVQEAGVTGRPLVPTSTEGGVGASGEAG